MNFVKICGITSVCDALLAAEAGANAIGLNLYAKSPRCLTLEQAKEIAEATKEGPEKIGVFVNAAVSDVDRAVRSIPLDAVQIHGDELPEYLRDLRQVLPTTQRPDPDNPQRILIYSSSIIRAFRWGGEDVREMKEYLERCQALDALPNGVLIDAQVEGAYGGTGHTVDWDSLAGWRDQFFGLPLFLSGGLTPDNVEAAIMACGPTWVDVASGVESATGVKDAERMEQFVFRANMAWVRYGMWHMFDDVNELVRQQRLKEKDSDNS